MPARNQWKFCSSESDLDGLAFATSGPESASGRREIRLSHADAMPAACDPAKIQHGGCLSLPNAFHVFQPPPPKIVVYPDHKRIPTSRSIISSSRIIVNVSGSTTMIANRRTVSLPNGNRRVSRTTSKLFAKSARDRMSALPISGSFSDVLASIHLRRKSARSFAATNAVGQRTIVETAYQIS